MEKIDSFKVDHLRLKRGIYVSRVDTSYGGDKITTYDIRVREPNNPFEGDAAHTLEHLIATYLRNEAIFREDVIYFGPMGCLTGFYLILKGERTPEDIWFVVRDAFRYAVNASEIPGIGIGECGNYMFHDIEKARRTATEFVTYLSDGPTYEATHYPFGKIAFICAMPSEPVKIKTIANSPEFHGMNVGIIVCGIGKANAAAETERVINEFHPDIIVSFGFAGGISGHGLRPGELVIAQNVLYHDVWCGEPNKPGQVQGMPPKFKCEKYDALTAAVKRELGITVGFYGDVATGDAFITDDSKIKEMSRDIIAVDMEAAAIAQICHKHGVKFAAYKLISDMIGDEEQLSDYTKATKDSVIA